MIILNSYRASQNVIIFNTTMELARYTYFTVHSYKYISMPKLFFKYNSDRIKPMANFVI